MHKLLIILSLGLFSAISHGDIVARYALGEETVVLSYRDPQHIRLDTSRGGYSLISGDRAVAVINQGDRQMVMDVDQMGAVLKAFRNKPDTAEVPSSEQVTVTPTGERREIAGIKGRVFVINDGKRDYSVVLTDHDLVVTAGEAMAKFFRRFANSMKNDQGARLLALEKVYRDQEYRGLLQAQGGLKLLAIAEEERPGDFYRAPASAVSFTMPGLTGLGN